MATIEQHQASCCEHRCAWNEECPVVDGLNFQKHPCQCEKQELAALRARLTEAEEERNAAYKHESKLSANVMQLKIERDNLAVELEHHKANFNNARAQVAQLSAQVEALKAKLQNAEEDANSLYQELEKKMD